MLIHGQDKTCSSIIKFRLEGASFRLRHGYGGTSLLARSIAFGPGGNFLLLFAPGIPQGNGAIKNRSAVFRILLVSAEVTQAFELISQLVIS